MISWIRGVACEEFMLGSSEIPFDATLQYWEQWVSGVRHPGEICALLRSAQLVERFGFTSRSDITKQLSTRTSTAIFFSVGGNPRRQELDRRHRQREDTASWGVNSTTDTTS